MELTITTPKKVNAKYLTVWIPIDRFERYYDDGGIKFGDTQYNDIEEFLAKYPELKDREYLMLIIDIDAQKVINWPENCAYEFYDMKIVDEGCYAIDDNEHNTIGYYEGYVPGCVGEGGWGDYLEFEIDNECNAIDINVNQKTLDSFMEEVRGYEECYCN